MIFNDTNSAYGLGTVGTRLLPAAFVTGSQVYGKPTVDSDIDFVVRCDIEVGDMIGLIALDAVCLHNKGLHYSRSSTTLRFGKLNLILCHTDEAYEAWKEGTREAYERRPVSRDHAIKIMKHFREKFGVVGDYNSNSDE
jgi:hypothetical protein